MRTNPIFLVALVGVLGAMEAQLYAQGKKKSTPDSDAAVTAGKPKPAEPARPQWEYRVIQASEFYDGNNFQGARLNKIGAEGWELVTIDPSVGPSASRGYSMYVFRREITAQPKAKPNADPAPKQKGDAKLELRVYPMREGTNALELANLLNEVLHINKFNMRIVAERRTNQVIVNGTEYAHIAVDLLLRQLDRPAANDPAGAPKKPAPQSKDKAPPIFENAEYVYLTHINPNGPTPHAYLRDRLARVGGPEFKAEVNDRFKFEKGEKMIATAKVVHVGQREIVLLVEKSYYRFQIGQSIGDALKNPLSAERIKELKLPAP